MIARRPIILFLSVAIASACGGILGLNEDDPPTPKNNANTDASANADASLESDGGGGATNDSPSPLGCIDCRVFVLSTEIQSGNDGLTSALAADALCDAVGRGEKGTLRGKHFTAWVSDPKSAAPSRLSPVAKTFRVFDSERNGKVVADSLLQFITGPHQAPISFNENGDSVDDSILWTGTYEDGGTSADTCDAWSRNSSKNGTTGSASKSDKDWTNSASTPCDSAHRIYCVER